MKIEPVVLQGVHVRLEPLTESHLDRLTTVGLEPSLWEFTPTAVTTRDEMQHYIAEALRQRDARTALPFATVNASSGQVIGSTRFANADSTHRRVEIGWTWIAPGFQRSAVNTETKLLMLQHAFDTWRCRRLELKTSSRNQRSRAAILRLGAEEEGTFRNHMLNADGSSRDTVWFSIIENEWPGVRDRLRERLGRPA